jgi:hypothetical protein
MLPRRCYSKILSTMRNASTANSLSLHTGKSIRSPALAINLRRVLVMVLQQPLRDPVTVNEPFLLSLELPQLSLLQLILAIQPSLNKFLMIRSLHLLSKPVKVEACRLVLTVHCPLLMFFPLFSQAPLAIRSQWTLGSCKVTLAATFPTLRFVILFGCIHRRALMEKTYRLETRGPVESLCFLLLARLALH